MKIFKFGSSKKFIVFLHGWGADKNSFLWLKNYFEEYSLVFVDFDGFGECEESKDPLFLNDYVLDLKKNLDEFEIENLIVVGHSFGGRVAIKFSFLFQNSYKNYALVLIDSAGILPKRTLIYYYKIYKYKALKRLSKKFSFLKKKLLKFGSTDYKKLSSTMKQTFVNVVNEDLSCYAKKIQCKTLIVWGEKDKETKMYMARKLNKFIKNSSLVVFQNCGHFSFLENKQEFLITLDTFIKNL